MDSSERLLVVADDLTGANDTSVTFADAGFETVLVHNAEILGDVGNAGVVAMSTDSRAAGERAAVLTGEVVERGLRGGITKLYLKVDSTMRGSVEHQIRGALDAWKRVHANPVALVCPAFPKMGRTVENGVLRVNGVPVAETPSGRDLVQPVLNSEMTKLIPHARHLQLTDRREALRTMESGVGDVFVFDAESDEDLVKIAELAALIGDRAILVGSAGLASAWISRGNLPESSALDDDSFESELPPLVIVTSIHETSQSQVDRFIGSRYGLSSTVFSPHPRQLIEDDALDTLIEQVGVLARNINRPTVIRANPLRLETDRSPVELARDFAGKLALMAKAALANRMYGSVVLVGGDGGEQVIRSLRISSMKVVRSVGTGVPMLEARDGDYPGLRIVTKSGGFGDPDLLIELIGKVWRNTHV